MVHPAKELNQPEFREKELASESKLIVIGWKMAWDLWINHWAQQTNLDSQMTTSGSQQIKTFNC